MKKYISSFVLATALCAAFTSCEKDGDIIYATGAESAGIETSASEIVLDKAHLDALVLSVYWTGNGDITLSDPLVAAPSNAVTNVIQLSDTEDFGNVVEEPLDGGVFSRQYTCRDLNNLVSRLGLEGGVRSDVFVRVKSYLSNNIPPVYSDVLALHVTPYSVDMTIAFYLNSTQEDTGRILWSPAADGIYTGFIGASGWENWWLLEGNNTMWGNDGVIGTAFLMGSSATGLDIWNFWYPEYAGCYYTVANTQTKEWTALLVQELNISGDLTGSMTFNRVSNTWTYTFNAASAGTINVSLAGNGLQYNMATGTDNTLAIATPVGFGGTSDAVTFGQTASAIAVEVPAAGETTLTLDLSDPRAWTLKAGEGAAAPVEVIPEMIYLPGIVDPWTFEQSLRLYSEDSQSYAGIHYTESAWGYQVAVEYHNWDDVYKVDPGADPMGGSLVFQGPENVPSITPAGIYVFDISIANLKYKVLPINTLSYAGANNVWDLTPLTPTDDPCVFTCEFVKTENAQYGVQIVVDDWVAKFGGNGNPGEICYEHDGFHGDEEFEDGTTLILTVDMAKGTYSYSKK